MKRFMKKGLALILLAAMVVVLLPENLGGIEFAWAEDEHTHVDENGKTFQPWNSGDSLPTTPGNYYLTKDVELADHSPDWTASEGEIRICLNGYSVEEPTYLYEFYVKGDSKLFIYDCAEEEECGSIYGRINVEDTASVTVNGGWIYGKSDHTIEISEGSSGTVTVNGGTIGDLNLTWPAIYNYEYEYEDNEGNTETFTGTATIKNGSILSKSNGVNNAAIIRNVGRNRKRSRLSGSV